MPYWFPATFAPIFPAMLTIAGFGGLLFPRQTFRFLARLGRSRETPEWTPEIERAFGARVRRRLAMMLVLLFGAMLAWFEIQQFIFLSGISQDVADQVAHQLVGSLGWAKLLWSLGFLMAGIYLAWVPNHFSRWFLKRRMSLFPCESPEQQKAEVLKLVCLSRIMGLMLLCIGSLGLWAYLLVNGLLSF